MERRVEAMEKIRSGLAQIHELQTKEVDADTLSSTVINTASRLAPDFAALNGQPFDPHRSAEVRELSRLVETAGGFSKWANAVGDRE